jgi:hypothetical protein
LNHRDSHTVSTIHEKVLISTLSGLKSAVSRATNCLKFWALLVIPHVALSKSKNNPKIFPNIPCTCRLSGYPIRTQTLTRIEDTDMVTATANGRRNTTAQNDRGTTMATATMEDKGRLQALERALGQIEKSFGKGSIMRLDANATNAIVGIPTGALSLDIALGGRGVPRGRVVEIFGPESSGKTTLALSIIASSQKSASTLMKFSFRSPTPASRPWKSASCWSDPMLLMWW